MKTNNTRTSQLQNRNEAILKDFVKLYSSGYRPDVIFERLSKKYFIAPETIQKITNREAKRANDSS